MGRCGNFTLLVIKLLLDWHVAVITHQKKIFSPLRTNECHGSSAMENCQLMLEYAPTTLRWEPVEVITEK